ncbi:MAG TPA: hypothetical protein VML75_27030 [Kofleriaceae bacterium]|nr:hypothetical protein [Kofleriaceae bacterium]
MNRRSFMIRVGGVLVAVPAVLQLTACGDDGGGGGADAAPVTSFAVSSAGSDHTHMITVQCTDLSSTGDVTYTSSNAGGHTHSVVVPAADLATVLGGGSVTITTDEFHVHTWTISKPANAC